VCGNGGMCEERGCVGKKKSTCVLRYILIIVNYLI